MQRTPILLAFLVLAFAFSLRAQQNVLITEFMAGNRNTLQDADADSSDWIEIYNPGTSTVNLRGWFLTDSTDNLTLWPFPDVSLAANSYLVVFASEKNRTNELAQLHTNFKLSSSGEYLALVSPDGITVASEFSPRFPPQQDDISYGRDQTSPEVLGYFLVATPGKPNSTSGPGFAGSVRFSRPSGHFTEAFLLLLENSAASSNAVIRYTVNGSPPTESSPIYNYPVAVGTSMQVRARVFEPGLLPGPMASENYFALHTNVVDFASDLPIVVFHNLGRGPVPTDPLQPVVLELFEPKNGRSSLTNLPDVSTRAAFKRRGSSSQDIPKASFAVELWDELNDDKDMSLLGLPADSDWVFYAPNNFDPVLMHNPFIFEVSNQIGRYAPRTRFVEVYLNTTGGPLTTTNYNGIYVLMEKIKRGPERVDIDELGPEQLQPPEITGGYMLKIDRADPGDFSFSAGGQSMNYVDPEGPEIRLPQRDPQEKYIIAYFNSFNTALNGTNYTNPTNGYAQFVNVDSWIDHHILNVMAFNVDALRLSGYFYKPRHGKITMGPIWDFDRALDSTDGRDSNPRVWRAQTGDMGTDFFNYVWWRRMFSDPNFWQKWIDRWQNLRTDLFSTNHLESIIDSMADQVRQAQPREAVRWAGLTTPRFGSYQGEVNHLKQWLRDRINFIDTNFVAAPRLNQNGGQLSPGFNLEMTTASGTIYYTLNGTDPRQSGGGISPGALIYTAPIPLAANARVVARTHNASHRNLTGLGNPPISSPWSGPATALFIVRTPTLVITEIMYHPAPGGVESEEEFEYLELRNIGPAALDLNGVHFSDGIEFTFTGSGLTNLGPGEHVLVVKNRAAFISRYGNLPNIAGEYLGSLDNSGERIVLAGALDEPILDFSYNDGWHPITDGPGFSLVILDENESLTTWGDLTSWRVSGAVHGSPGQADPPAPVLPRIVINEALTRSEAPQVDAIELFNPTTNNVNIGGWFLTDDFSRPRKFRIPGGTLLSSGRWATFTESHFNAAPASSSSFSLSSRGEEVYLFSGDAQTNLTGYVHGFRFGAAESGVSFGRHITSTGDEHFVAQEARSPDLANVGPKVGPVVIAEIMYHPPEPPGHDNVPAEYIRLHNASTNPVPLFDPLHPENAWRLAGAVDFFFPTNISLPPTGALIIVSFDPGTDPAAATHFRNRNGLGLDVPIHGPYIGKLDNSGESVDLYKPDEPVSGLVPYVLVDQVEYSNAAPWPTGADGSGSPLQRLDLAAYGNDPTNWWAPALARPVISMQPESVATHPEGQATFRVAALSSTPISYQWRHDGTHITGATNATLTMTNVQPAQGGDYSVVVTDGLGATASDPAKLIVLLNPVITLAPASQTVRSSVNVTFSTAALSSTPLSYQWQLNGTDLFGATNATLILTNVQPTHRGDYSIRINDGFGTVTSHPAKLTVMIAPIFVRQPEDRTVVAGGSVTLEVKVVGTAPFGYRWRRNLVTVVPFGAGKATLTITNAQMAHAGTYSVVITNLAILSSGVPSSNAVLTVLADTDGDHIPDHWEMANGFGTNSVEDAALDTDGDGMSNFQEYEAGTDPRDVASVMRMGDVTMDGNDVRIAFRGVTGKKYRLERLEDMAANTWAGLIDFKVGTVLDVELIDTGGANRPHRIYQVRLLP